MFMEKENSIIFDKNTIEFVTVAAEFCGFLERASEMSREEFTDRLLKLLPLLYLKASLLPSAVCMDDGRQEVFVTEGDYECLRSALAAVMGSKDDYLEVFVEDMAYSDMPVKQNISENLADIYQPLKDFICIFSQGLDRTMHDALVICSERFAEYWGSRLVNAMRALHAVKYAAHDTAADEDGDSFSKDDGMPDERAWYDFPSEEE